MLNAIAFPNTDDSRTLAALVEVNEALTGTLDLRAALHAALGSLQRHHEILRSAVTLLRRNGDELLVEAERGLPEAEPRARYRIGVGEGITGRVVRDGAPIVVPRISDEPRFLHRAWRENGTEEITFVAAPILLDGKPVGALSADVRYREEREYERLVEFVRIVASMIAQAVRVHRLIEADRRHLVVEENSHLREELRERYDFSNLVGNSGAMRRVYEQISQVAPTNASVLIRGESGTGKELIAHALHYNSPRAQGPFVKVNCSALPVALIESELFGYEKGAFTGANARKKGRFELADGGTLFLDEIGALAPALQVKLLRALQEREFERVGGTTTLHSNVRLIAATNKDLEAAMAEGAFREDLYYRLNAFAIFVPALRERKPDVLLLANHFLEKHAAEHDKSIERISTSAIDMLMAYHWPGNVRELENAIERAVLVCDSNVIHGHHLPPTLQTGEATGTVKTGTLEEIVTAYERNIIEDALKTTRGNVTQAAKLLQTTGRILGYRVRKYGIDCDRFR